VTGRQTTDRPRRQTTLRRNHEMRIGKGGIACAARAIPPNKNIPMSDKMFREDIYLHIGPILYHFVYENAKKNMIPITIPSDSTAESEAPRSLRKT